MTSDPRKFFKLKPFLSRGFSSPAVNMCLSTGVAQFSAELSRSSSFNPAAAATSAAASAIRVRTVLTEYQLRVLRTCYAVCPRPDHVTRDRLIEMTGLSGRVIRVWFQNRRCKDKKRSGVQEVRTVVNSRPYAVSSSQTSSPTADFGMQSDNVS